MLDIKEKRHITVVGRGGASNIDWDDIENKPDFATVATSGSYNDLTDKPEIPGQVNADWDATSGVSQILNKPNLATVATSGSYDDLSNKPTIPSAQVNSDWDATSGVAQILNKPELATVATSGSYNDLTNKPDLTHYVEDTDLATVATSGSYNDLTNKPAVKEDLDLSTLTQAQYVDFYTNYATYKANYDLNWGGLPIVSINSWQPDASISPVPLIVLQYGIYGQSALMTGGDDEVYFGVQLIGADGSVTPYSSSMTFKQICHTASYNDLVDKPTIPAAQVNADWDANSGVSQILNKPTLATVATSGSYNDLSNKPTIPAAQVNADWDANSGVSQILNKPTLATVATSGSYNDLSDKPTVTQEQADWSQTDTTAVDYIKNKPEIPSVPAMATQELTFTLQGGTIKTIEFYTVPNYFYVEDISGSDNTLTIKKNISTAPTIEVFSSTDRMNWESMGTTSNTAITATIPANGKLYLKANANALWCRNNDRNTISASGNHNVGGNILSLIYGDNFEGKTTLPTTSYYGNSGFTLLFENNTKLINANNLILPLTTTIKGVYQSMFRGCTALTTAPELPVATLTDECYGGMFNGCTSLTTAPVLPATTLATYCYAGMFSGCTSLTAAPALPATTLPNSCYSQMFKGCTSLTTAPELPATTLAQMCYMSIFEGCTSLTTAPALPATTLALMCYMNMFKGCTNLNKVTTYAQDISASNCLSSWLSSVSAQGDFYNLGGATYPSGTSGIPTGWTVHTSL